MTVSLLFSMLQDVLLRVTRALALHFAILRP